MAQEHDEARGLLIKASVALRKAGLNPEELVAVDEAFTTIRGYVRRAQDA